MSIKNLEEFKQYLTEKSLPFHADIVGKANQITPSLLIKACKEFGWVDFLIANCHNLVLTEEEFQHIIDTTLKIEELQYSMESFIGEEKFNELNTTISEKWAVWYDLNKDDVNTLVTSDWLDETPVDTVQNGE